MLGGNVCLQTVHYFVDNVKFVCATLKTMILDNVNCCYL